MESVLNHWATREVPAGSYKKQENGQRENGEVAPWMMPFNPFLYHQPPFLIPNILPLPPKKLEEKDMMAFCAWLLIKLLF